MLCVPLPVKHISVVICVSLPRKHIFLLICGNMCVLIPGKHTALVICVPLPRKHISLVLIFFLGRGTHVPGDKNVNLSSSTSPLAFYHVPSSGMRVTYTFCVVTLFTFYRTFYRNTPMEGVVREKKNLVWLD